MMEKETETAAEPGAGFDSRGISLRAQKKLVSKMSSKQIIRSLINETAGQVLDHIHKVLKQYKNKKEADVVLKYLIKSVLKMVILHRNDQFSREELKFLEEFITKFHTLSSTLVSFYEDRSKFDKYLLQNSLEECRVLSQSIIDRHLSSKSKKGLNLVFETLSEPDLLDALYNNESYQHNMEQIVGGLKQLQTQDSPEQEVSKCPEQKEKVAEPGAGFDSRGISLRAQKKLVSKMSNKKIIKSFINETAGHVLDHIHKVLKQYKNKKEANVMLKYLIKSVLKLAILYRNDQFSREELKLLEQFTSKFQTLASTVILFYENKSRYDKSFLQNILEECRVLSQSVIDRHLTSKSKEGFNLIFNTMSEPDLLDAMYTDESYQQNMTQIVSGLKQLKSQNEL